MQWWAAGEMVCILYYGVYIMVCIRGYARPGGNIIQEKQM